MIIKIRKDKKKNTGKEKDFIHKCLKSWRRLIQLTLIQKRETYIK